MGLRLDDEDLEIGNVPTYYVAQNGSDEKTGTEEQPWRTIQKAAETLNAGDTVLIKAGSADNYIVYAAYPGDTVTIDGDGISLSEEWDEGMWKIRVISEFQE